MYDVAVIGGGPAGLATAYRLERAGLSVLVFEETERLGGRALSVEIHGEAVNLGAMFVYSGTQSHRLAEELGIELSPFLPETVGIHVGDTTVVATDNARLVERLSLDDEEKAALLTYLQHACAEYEANTVDGQLRPTSETFGEESAERSLVGLPVVVQEILEAAIRGGSVARPAELSATYALRYFASYLVHEKKNRLVAAGGIQAIPLALAAGLRSTELRTGARVTAVTPSPTGGWCIDVETADGAGRECARHVVMAVPSPVIPELTELPAWKRDALDRVRTPGSTVLGVVAEVGDDGPDGDIPYDDWAFVVTPGRPFDAIINPQPGRRSGVAQFVCYGNSSGYVPEAEGPDAGVLDAWIEEFLKVAPGLRGRILGAEIRTWRHCFSLLSPERNAVLDELQAPVGTMHFAGDYSSATAGTHGAYAEAERVAREIVDAERTAGAFIGAPARTA